MEGETDPERSHFRALQRKIVEICTREALFISIDEATQNMDRKDNFLRQSGQESLQRPGDGQNLLWLIDNILVISTCSSSFSPLAGHPFACFASLIQAAGWRRVPVPFDSHL